MIERKDRALDPGVENWAQKIGLHVRHALPSHVMYQKSLIPRQKRVLPLQWQTLLLANQHRTPGE